MEIARNAGSHVAGQEPGSNHKPFHTDEGAVAFRPTGGAKKELNKQSFDYVLRTGLAGGLAGCAVRHMMRRDAGKWCLTCSLYRQRRLWALLTE